MRFRPEPERRGTATVELAVLLPFLVALFLFAADFARILYYTITLENCVENAALYGSQVFNSQNNTQYWQGLNGQLVSQETAASELDGFNLSPGLADSNVSVSSNTDADGNTVNLVTISYTFKTLVPYPGVPSPVTIVRTAQVRVAPP